MDRGEERGLQGGSWHGALQVRTRGSQEGKAHIQRELPLRALGRESWLEVEERGYCRTHIPFFRAFFGHPGP